MGQTDLLMLGRILLAAVLGLVIGWERERHSRAAGLRTCMLVATASALLMCLSIHLGDLFAPAAAGSVFRLDPGRLPSYAVAGMGFLGAGAIIQGRGTAQGVTTAAALWTCTGIGLSAGAGLYWPAIFTSALALAALTLLRRLENYIPRRQYVTLIVEADGPEADPRVRALLEGARAKINFVGRDRRLAEHELVYRYSLAIRSGPGWSEMLDSLELIPGVKRYHWHQSQVP